VLQLKASDRCWPLPKRARSASHTQRDPYATPDLSDHGLGAPSDRSADVVTGPRRRCAPGVRPRRLGRSRWPCSVPTTRELAEPTGNLRGCSSRAGRPIMARGKSVARSASTGRFVSKATARRSPSRTTSCERVGDTTKNSRTVNRSAGTGRFVTKAHAFRSPKTTIQQRV
jgi:hypothetical protein